MIVLTFGPIDEQMTCASLERNTQGLHEGA